mgnify:FL=1
MLINDLEYDISNDGVHHAHASSVLVEESRVSSDAPGRQSQMSITEESKVEWTSTSTDEKSNVETGQPTAKSKGLSNLMKQAAKDNQQQASQEFDFSSFGF